MGVFGCIWRVIICSSLGAFAALFCLVDLSAWLSTQLMSTHSFQWCHLSSFLVQFHQLSFGFSRVSSFVSIIYDSTSDVFVILNQRFDVSSVTVSSFCGSVILCKTTRIDSSSKFPLDPFLCVHQLPAEVLMAFFLPIFLCCILWHGVSFSASAVFAPFHLISLFHLISAIFGLESFPFPDGLLFIVAITGCIRYSGA